MMTRRRVRWCSLGEWWQAENDPECAGEHEDVRDHRLRVRIMWVCDRCEIGWFRAESDCPDCGPLGPDGEPLLPPAPPVQYISGSDGLPPVAWL